MRISDWSSDVCSSDRNDGYLRGSFSDLTQSGQFSPIPSEGEWRTALLMVQQLGFPGDGARDLSECLSLQIKALPADPPGRDLAMEMAGRSDERPVGTECVRQCVSRWSAQTSKK